MNADLCWIRGGPQKIWLELSEEWIMSRLHPYPLTFRGARTLVQLQICVHTLNNRWVSGSRLCGSLLSPSPGTLEGRFRPHPPSSSLSMISNETTSILPTNWGQQQQQEATSTTKVGPPCSVSRLDPHTHTHTHTLPWP